MQRKARTDGEDRGRLGATVTNALGAESGAPTPGCVDPVAMLDWIEQGAAHAQAGSIQAHVTTCAYCRAEYGRWRQTYRLAAEARAKPRHSQESPDSGRPLQAHGGWLEGLREAFRVSLGALAPPQGAFASGDETRTLAFSVAGSGGRLAGSLLQRHGREYHAKVEPVDPSTATEFDGRLVRLTITDPALAQPLLRRNVAVGVLTLLGTLESGGALTDQSALAAELLPPDATAAS